MARPISSVAKTALNCSVPQTSKDLLEAQSKSSGRSMSDLVDRLIVECFSPKKGLANRLEDEKAAAIKLNAKKRTDTKVAVEKSKLEAKLILESAELAAGRLVELAELEALRLVEEADCDLASVNDAIDKEWKQSLQYSLEQALLSSGYPLYEKHNNKNFTRDNIRAFVDEKVADSVNSWACNENILLIATKHQAAAFRAVQSLVASTLSMKRFMDKPLAALDYIANSSICRCSDEYVEAFELMAQVSWSSMYSMSEPYSVFSASVDNKGVWSVQNGTEEYTDFVYKFECLDYEFGTKHHELYSLQTIIAGVWSD